MQKIDVEFTLERETKGTRVYKENSETPKIGSLYLKKSAAAELGNPDAIVATVVPKK